ncbi:McrB family protein [Pectobacterium versatile]|uniref:McrB family protein n=1 Tax=Pectobacterium versatile TaxID=2488639 RepID=UPI000D21FD02|nr:AAA family ATPase [Pectobacterium versatile]AVT56832.1 type IV methyl-directed restriction enzyme, NTPase subunit [Pectobacterium versatile]
MNFQQFCENISDGQKIVAKESLLLTYTNTKGEVFSISPDDIKSFLLFILEDFDTIYERWESVPTKKSEINNYEEKSYREIYKLADSDDLKVIASGGKSQTKSLTKLISKIIAYLVGEDYISLEENTFFSKEKISKAIDKWDLIYFDDKKAGGLSINKLNFKNEFYSWMISKGLSERTARSYSTTAISFSDKYLNQIGLKKSTLYSLSLNEVKNTLDLLKKIPDWLDRDQKGNNMYSSAINKLAEFLSEKGNALSLPKPFLLLAGISGTGKSRFVREQAEATGSRQETYCLVSVRPDWHEPSDLLGYTTRLNNNAEYVITDVLQFIVKAWKTIAETGVQIAGNKTSGNRNDLQAIPPYWLCLDEMNLAPVEQYFADYLSILETREWEWADDAFTYQCDPLLKASVIQSLSDDKRNELCKKLKLDPTSALWLEFSKHGIGIPFNLLVAGTVNMDETTHGFSRKVIDRALSFDFGDFFPNDFNEYFSPTVASKKLTYPIYSSAVKNKERLPVIDADGKASIQFLHALNTVLDNTPFKLAYRALNELLLSVISHQPEDEMQLQAVWDDFLMCKLLPRIEGDSDKLAQHDIDESLLIKLSGILKENLSAIWNQPNARQDFYREKQQDGETIMIACRSRAKIEWMQNKLAQSGFTSFWP